MSELLETVGRQAARTVQLLKSRNGQFVSVLQPDVAESVHVLAGFAEERLPRDWMLRSWVDGEEQALIQGRGTVADTVFDERFAAESCKLRIR